MMTKLDQPVPEWQWALISFLKHECVEGELLQSHHYIAMMLRTVNPFSERQ